MFLSPTTREAVAVRSSPHGLDDPGDLDRLVSRHQRNAEHQRRRHDETVPRIREDGSADRCECVRHCLVNRVKVDGRLGNEHLADLLELARADPLRGLGHVPQVEQRGHGHGDALLVLGSL